MGMSTSPDGAVLVGLPRATDRREARELIEVRPGWSLLAAVATSRGVAERIEQAAVVIVDDRLSELSLVLQAVAAARVPPALTILTTDAPGVAAARLGCSVRNVVRLVPGQSLHTVLLSILSGLESRSGRSVRRFSERAPEIRPAFGSAPSRASDAAPSPVRRSIAPQSAAPVAPTRPGVPARRELLVIGSSTGGPEALAAVLTKLPRDLRCPVLITQHMPRTFTELLAATLDRQVPFTVREAHDGDVAKPGTVFIAPGGSHMVVVDRMGTIRLNQDPPEHNCRPSVDVLFRSVTETYGRSVVAVVLTGMGTDGALGAVGLSKRGAYVIAQDEESSVVWGMPGAVVNAGVANEVLPVGQIGNAIAVQFSRGPRPANPRETEAADA